MAQEGPRVGMTSIKKNGPELLLYFTGVFFMSLLFIHYFKTLLKKKKPTILNMSGASLNRTVCLMLNTKSKGNSSLQTREYSATAGTSLVIFICNWHRTSHQQLCTRPYLLSCRWRQFYCSTVNPLLKIWFRFAYHDTLKLFSVKVRQEPSNIHILLCHQRLMRKPVNEKQRNAGIRKKEFSLVSVYLELNFICGM